MKKVLLELTSCTINGEVLPLDYKEQLILLISNPADGMNLGEMRNIERVYDKLIDALCPGFVLLEDAEHATLKLILESAKFRVFDKDILLMVETVIASPMMTLEQVHDGAAKIG